MEEDFTHQEWETCLKVLQAVSDDITLADKQMRFQSLVAKINRQARGRKKKKNRKIQKSIDGALRGKAANNREQHYQQENVVSVEQKPDRLLRAQNCYVCKQNYFDIQPLYHLMCEACAKTNIHWRNKRADLSGRTAIITGGRVKIGFYTVLKLLRDGASVVVTTRFPADAVERYKQEQDYEDWQDRLYFYGLDLRYLADVEDFCLWLNQQFSAVDIVINNAAQTIWRPPDFYAHLVAAEKKTLLENTKVDNHITQPAPLKKWQGDQALALKEEWFPVGQLDRDKQQLDLRPENSWSAKLGDIDTGEMAQAQLVNAMAPFILCSKLKPLLQASDFEQRFIINVSSMEGQFNRRSKTDSHPHTNMSKAALNMLTRTSGADYAKDQIYMTAVDTGWITNENPYPKTAAMREKHFVPPLDLIDGAARILHPVYQGIEEEGETPYFGVFLKDYAPFAW